jgi:hypothetical protein
VERFCICGNPQAMQQKSGQFGAFLSCSDWKCDLTQSINEPQPPVGSVNQQRTPLEPPADMVLHSKQVGYEQRMTWHEKRGIPLPETNQHQAMHMSGYKK